MGNIQNTCTLSHSFLWHLPKNILSIVEFTTHLKEDKNDVQCSTPMSIDSNQPSISISEFSFDKYILQIEYP